jgi:hypothetical protein
MSGVGNVLYPRPKNTSKLSTRIDADGKEVEVTRKESIMSNRIKAINN